MDMKKYTVVQLRTLLNEYYDTQVEQLLASFTADDLEREQEFLQRRSIPYEYQGLDRTYLIFAKVSKQRTLVGYFSLAVKSINTGTANWKRLSTKSRALIAGGAATSKLPPTGVKSVPGFLIGQVGRDSRYTEAVAIKDVIAIAEEQVQEISELIGGRLIWTLLNDSGLLLNAYLEAGYVAVKMHESPTGNEVMLVKELG